jgi:hypothetical protein
VSKDTLAASRTSKPKAAAPRLVVGSDGNIGLAVTSRDDGPTNDGAPSEKSASHNGEPAKPPAIKWAAADKNEPQGTGPLQVTITKVVVGRVATKLAGEAFELGAEPTPDPYLSVWFHIKNTDAAGSTEYVGWMGKKAEEAKIESSLIDDRGHEHKHVPFPPDTAIKGTKPAAPIFAGQAVDDALVFSPLPAEVEAVELVLSGKAVGQEEDLHFRIPRTMIKADDSNPLIGGARN